MTNLSLVSVSRRQRARARPGFRSVFLVTPFLALLIGIGFSPRVLGDEEACVEGRGASAIRACRAALSAGSTRRSVYLALGRHLERSGKHADAVAVYRKGLRAHPGDATLKSRLKVAQSNVDEQKFISKRGSGSSSAPSAEAKARFKVNQIRCKTLSGSQALAACKSALSVKPGDAALQRRLKELSGSTSQKAVADTRNEAQRAADAEEAARLAAEREKQKALIANIQDRLTRLGFDPGPVDGLPGARTRSAVEQLASMPVVSLPSRELDQALSDALDKALESDETARERMKGAERSLDAGDLSAARESIDQALALAPWSKTLGETGERLRARSVEIEAGRQQLATAEDLAEQARGARESGDFAKSLALVDEALALTPDDADLGALRLILVTELDRERQREAEAREGARRAQEAERQQEIAEVARASLDLDGALAAVKSGLEQMPDHPGLLALRTEVEADLMQRKQYLARAQAERERQEAEERARKEQELAKAAERRAAISRLSAEAEEAAGQGDLDRAMVLLDQALEQTAQARGLNPEDPSIERLSARLAEARRVAEEDLERWEQRRERLEQVKAVLRERSQQLAKVEAEIVSRELRAKLEAQQVLERAWGGSGTASD